MNPAGSGWRNYTDSEAGVVDAADSTTIAQAIDVNLASVYICTHREDRMDIGFVWDDRKYREVVKRHDVLFHEVVSAFDDEHGYEVPDPAGHEDRFVLVAAAATGRVLFIVVGEEDLPLYRIITAFDAEGSWLDEYEKES